MLEVSEVKQMELADYMDIKQEIRNNLNQVVVSFVQIGFYLKKVNSGDMYKQDGYKDIWKFAKAEYNLDRTAASRFMSINDRYSVNGNSLELQEQYRGLSKSTLVEMLTLPVEDYELITSDTRISDIRELKKEEQAQADEQLEGQESIMSLMPEAVPEEDKLKKEVSIHDVIRDLFRPRDMKDLLNRLVVADPNDKSFEYIIEELNPSGNRVAKKIPYFIFFYKFQDGIKVKNVVGGPIMRMTYKEFYFEVRGTYHRECIESPSDVWSAAYGDETSDQTENQVNDNMEVKNAESLDFPQSDTTSNEPEKVPETTEMRSEESVIKSHEPVVEEKIPENEPMKNAESLDSSRTDTNSDEPETEETEVVTGEVEEEDKTVCDIAQDTDPETGNLAGYTITLPVAPGAMLYRVRKKDTYYAENIEVGAYEITKRTITVSGYDETGEHTEETILIEGSWEEKEIYRTRQKAEERAKELNGKE